MAPGGQYNGSFVVADSIIVDMGTNHGFRDTITHEQHDVPAGLRGNVLFEDELHTSGTDIAITSGDTTFDITIDNPPIRVGHTLLNHHR